MMTNEDQRENTNEVLARQDKPSGLITAINFIGSSVGDVLKLLLREFALWLAIVIAVIITMYSVSINAGRINDMTTTTAKIQEISGKMAANPQPDTLKAAKDELAYLIQRRDDLIMKSTYGNNEFYQTSYWTCATTTMPPCFYKHSSEMNSIIIAFASGIIGSGIFILRSITASSFMPVGNTVPQAVSLGLNFRGFSRLLFGGIVGLLALFFIRGTKGALISPVVGVVQVDNPYGTAFMSVIAVLFFDRFFDYLDKWMTQIKVGQDSKPVEASSVITKQLPGNATGSQANSPALAPSGSNG